MKLKQLITALKRKPDQNQEVEFVVYNAATNAIVTVELSGTSATPLIGLLSKRKPTGK